MLFMDAYRLGDRFAPAHPLWAKKRLDYRKGLAFICVVVLQFFQVSFGYRPGEGVHTIFTGSFWTNLRRTCM